MLRRKFMTLNKSNERKERKGKKSNEEQLKCEKKWNFKSPNIEQILNKILAFISFN